MNVHVSTTDLCCMCERPNYSLRSIRNATGCRWVTLELTDQSGPVTWFVACAPCLCLCSLRFHASNQSTLRDMPCTYYHDNTKQFEDRVEKIIKNKLVDKAYIEAADVDKIAVVQLRRELRNHELDEIQATREL